MPKKGKIQMPQSTAGLIRYFEESKEAIKIKPEHVLAICLFFTALVVAMKFIL